MNKAAVVLALVASSACLAAAALSDAEAWKQYKARFGKSYAAREDARRFEHFRQNMERAEELTAVEGGSATFGATPFSDLSRDEFRAQYLGLNRAAHHSLVSRLPRHPAAAAGERAERQGMGIDWRDAGIVTSVKNQGSCGSCWAFASVAAAEGCLGLGSGYPTELSPQQLVDCCHEGGSAGCDGGDEDACMDWMTERSIATLKSYPYKGVNGECQPVKQAGMEAHDCGIYSAEPGEHHMLRALELNVLAVAIEADVLQLYTGGVVSQYCNYTQLNHAVLLVGDSGAGDSWVVKNSWGASWGEAGYFRLAKWKNCLGISDDVAFFQPPTPGKRAPM